MIPVSRTAAAASLFAAVGLHGAGFMWPGQHIPVETAAGASAINAKLGAGFADLVAGIKTPVDGADITAPVAPPDTAQPETPTTVQPVTAPAPELPPLQPTLPTPAVVTKPEMVEPVAETMVSSPRPAERPTRVPKTASKPKRPKTGNSKKNATAGTATGSTTGQTANTGRVSSGKVSKQGNAAADNYPGQVFRKISRARRQTVNVKGACIVSFTIASNGALSAARVSRSSGSAKLDQVALAQIKRAAPFPAPPTGARRTYSVEVKGR